APLFPCRIHARRRALSTCDQSWLTHRATVPSERTGPGNVPSGVCLAGDFPAGQHLRCGTPPPGPTPHSIDRVLPHSPWAVPDGRPDGEDGRRSLGALLRNTREQCTNLGLPVAPVSPQRADRG